MARHLRILLKLSVFKTLVYFATCKIKNNQL